MSIQNKPDYKVFASDAKSGEIDTFPDILRGWGVTIDRTGEIPPMEWFNAIGKRVDEWLLYLTQRGVAEWDAALSYPKTAIVQFNSVIYVSIKETKGERPDNSLVAWSTLGTYLGLGNYQPKGDYATNTALSNGLAGKLDKTGGGLRGNNGVLYLSSTAANQPLFMSFFNSGSKLLGYVGRPDDKEDIALVNSSGGSVLRLTFDNRLTFNDFDVMTSNNVTQSVGTSTKSVMSQKAVTDAIAGISNNTASKSANGWWRCADTGIIYQWGTVDYSSRPDEKDYTFPFIIEFPNNSLNVSLTRKVVANSGTSGNDGGVLLVSHNRSSCTVNLALFNSNVAGLRGFSWFAIGY